MRELPLWCTFPNPFQAHRQIRKNKAHHKEYNTYLEKVLPPIASRLSKQLGWKVNTTIVHAMYKACSFEYSLFHNDKHWCCLFTQQDLLRLEYAGDIHVYWKHGFGSGLGYKMACPLFQDFVEHMEAKMAGLPSHEDERVRMRFAHAETLIPFLTLLVSGCNQAHQTHNRDSNAMSII